MTADILGILYSIHLGVLDPTNAYVHIVYEQVSLVLTKKLIMAFYVV